jgi:GDP-L-fucose synthase
MNQAPNIYVAGHRGMVGSAKVNQASSVTIWGTGTPKREFLYVDDMAAASVFVMNLPASTYAQQTQPQRSHLNVGYGSDVTILELAQQVATTVGYAGHILTDPSKPDGTPRKLMDSSRLNALGWQAQVGLEAGLKAAYGEFLERIGS